MVVPAFGSPLAGLGQGDLPAMERERERVVINEMVVNSTSYW